MHPMGQWVGQQGCVALGEGLNLSSYHILFTSLLQFWIFSDCFSSTPIKFKIYCWFLVGALWTKKLTVCIYFVFSTSVVLFKITTNFLLFSQFSWHIILKHTTAFYAKHRQVLANNKKSLLRKFSILSDKKSSTENRGTPLMHKIFRYHRFLETQKGSPTNFFGTKRQKNARKTW